MVKWKELDFVRLGLAFLFALVFGGLAGLAFEHRDFLFEWQRVKAVGKFSREESPELSRSAVSLAENKIARPGAVCVEQWIGRDERYLYMTVGCARFEEKLGEIRANGDGNFVPTRFRYRGEEAVSWEQPDMAEYENSMRRLFPKEAGDLVANYLNQDLYRKLGAAKQAAKP